MTRFPDENSNLPRSLRDAWDDCCDQCEPLVRARLHEGLAPVEILRELADHAVFGDLADNTIARVALLKEVFGVGLDAAKCAAGWHGFNEHDVADEVVNDAIRSDMKSRLLEIQRPDGSVMARCLTGELAEQEQGSPSFHGRLLDGSLDPRIVKLMDKIVEAANDGAISVAGMLESDFEDEGLTAVASDGQRHRVIDISRGVGDELRVMVRKRSSPPR